MTMPFVIHTFYPITGRVWVLAVPVVGQFVLALEVIGGKMPHPLAFALGVAAALGFTVLCIDLTKRLFEREAIIFNK
ncbi:MAG: hypothetical protein FJW31_00690 [Acidobacteria bacterium]|nr:hypothetical protein [Acidobacteriota bacterium]